MQITLVQPFDWADQQIELQAIASLNPDTVIDTWLYLAEQAKTL